MTDITTITTNGVTIVKFTGGIAEIIIDPAAPAEHVLDAMDLARIMLAHDAIAAKVVNPIQTQTGKRATTPVINVAHNEEETIR
jgi:hypothetical protein